MQEAKQDIEVPAWLTPGAKVAEFMFRPASRYPEASFTEVDRLTKTLVVLANGNRYRRDRLQRSTGTWGPTFHLKPCDDPDVQRALRITHVQRVAYDIDKLLQKLRNDSEDLTPLLEIARISAAWTGG